MGRNAGETMHLIRRNSALKLVHFLSVGKTKILIEKKLENFDKTIINLEYGTGRASKQFGLPESTARGFRDKLIKMLQVEYFGIFF